MIVLSASSPLALSDVRAVSLGSSVSLDGASLELIDSRRREIVKFVEAQEAPAYGFNRGFGHNVDVPVDKEGLSALQRNLIRSHASGVGTSAPREVVRATILLRAQSLLRGNSGVRSIVIRRLVDLLNADIVPVVPQFGSVGASGDLAPLSHIALALLGEGDVHWQGRRCSAHEALSATGIPPLELEMKEGLALNNGVQFSTAMGIVAAQQVSDLLKHAALATSISTQVLLGADTPFRRDLHELRPHPGSTQVASWLWHLMQGSPLRESHRHYDTDGEIQDPYSLRCAPQILGACLELISDAEKTLEIEINSATDNPLILQDTGGAWTDIVSGGHFHGMPVAVRLYGLLQACGIMARLSNMRCVRFVDQARNKGLGSDLIWPTLTPLHRSTSSSMMIPEYVSAALTNAIWGELMPNHVFSLSTDAGQEDHVSMSAGLGVKLLGTIPHLARTLAIELAFGAQAAAVRRELEGFPSKVAFSPEQASQIATLSAEATKRLQEVIGDDFTVKFSASLIRKLDPSSRTLNAAGEEVLSRVYQLFPPVTEDRELGSQLEALSELVMSGELLEVPEVAAAFAKHP